MPPPAGADADRLPPPSLDLDPASAPPSLDLDPASVPPPDLEAAPEGFVVAADDGTRLHFLDWGEPGKPAAVGPLPFAALLIPGFGQSAWSWAPVARRLRAEGRVVAMDLRGHGLSDAPVEGYDHDSLGADAVAVAEGAGLLAGASGPMGGGEDEGDRLAPPLVLAGHGFGAEVAATAAGLLGRACAGLVLVDGGWDSLAGAELTPEELVRSLDEPPEVLRSMAAFLADREAFDPASWDADQRRAARETVVQLPSRRLVPAIHPHVRDGIVASLLEYAPVEALAAVEAQIIALLAASDEMATRRAAFERTSRELRGRGRPPVRWAAFDAGHNLMRYRAAEVAAAIVAAIGLRGDQGGS